MHKDLVPFLAAPGGVQEEETCEFLKGKFSGLEEVGKTDEHAGEGEENGDKGGEAEG